MCSEEDGGFYVVRQKNMMNVGLEGEKKTPYVNCEVMLMVCWKFKNSQIDMLHYL